MSKYNIAEKRNKFKLRESKFGTPVLILGFIIVAFLSKAAWNAYMEKRQSDTAVNGARQELLSLEERQKFISKELERLQTNEGREAILREKFGVGSVGEQLAIIIDPQDEESSSKMTESFWNRVESIFITLFER